MAKYIDREALVEWLKRIPLKDLSDGLGLCRVIMEDDFKKAIKKMPKGIIADVAPVVHGQWLRSDDDWDSLTPIRCSICGEEWYFEMIDDDVTLLNYKYCPNCGARMDGGEDE